jgi:hypothetical protein
MAKLNGNNVYFTIDGTDVKAFWKSVSLNPTADTVDVTAGANATHKQYESGLVDTSLSATFAYDDASLATYIQRLRVGQKVLIAYGPEGATSGKPKHEQYFIVTSAATEQTVMKDAVVFDMSFNGADAPIVDMYAGGVWS